MPHFTADLASPQDKTTVENSCGVVYNIKCGECDSAYIGEAEIHGG